jgi:glycosyltransferase involved in cell wall biosynthesis
MPRVSIVIPTMNEEVTIGGVIDSIKKEMAHEEIEILVVDTNSKDRTREIASSKGARIIDEPRRGYGRAYKTGFERSLGEIIVTLDADGTYPSEDIPRLLDALEKENTDFVSGDRLSTLSSEAMSPMHRMGNRILNLATLFLFFHKVKDSQSGMWAFRRELLERIGPKSDGMPFSQEIKLNVITGGFVFKEIPISYRVRGGEIKLRPWEDGWNNLKYIFKMRFGRV